MCLRLRGYIYTLALSLTVLVRAVTAHLPETEEIYSCYYCLLLERASRAVCMCVLNCAARSYGNLAKGGFLCSVVYESGKIMMDLSDIN